MFNLVCHPSNAWKTRRSVPFLPAVVRSVGLQDTGRQRVLGGAISLGPRGGGGCLSLPHRVHTSWK